VGSGKLTAVTDSGPIIHLTEIGCLSILSIFGNLHVPDAVWVETVEFGRTSSENLLRLPNLHRHTLPQDIVRQFIENNNLFELHSGECECLYLSRQINVPLLLTDDLAVRETAKRLKLTPIGSLGIVAKAYHLGRISMTDAQSYIIDLYEMSSLFVTKTIVEMAIEQLQNPKK